MEPTMCLEGGESEIAMDNVIIYIYIDIDKHTHIHLV